MHKLLLIEIREKRNTFRDWCLGIRIFTCTRLRYLLAIHEEVLKNVIMWITYMLIRKGDHMLYSVLKYHRCIFSNFKLFFQSIIFKLNILLAHFSIQELSHISFTFITIMYNILIKIFDSFTDCLLKGQIQRQSQECENF